MSVNRRSAVAQMSARAVLLPPRLASLSLTALPAAPRARRPRLVVVAAAAHSGGEAHQRRPDQSPPSVSQGRVAPAL